MRVAAVQLRCRREDPEGTITSALRLLRKAKREDAELACLPELWLPEEFALQHKGLQALLQDAAKENDFYLITGALPQNRQTGPEIVAHLISPKGEILGSQSKIHLFRSQRDKYQQAKSITPINTPIGSIGMLVCYDDVFPEAPRRLVLDGADVIFIPSRIVKQGVDPWHLYLKVRALENRVQIVAPNVVEPPLFNGHSLVVDLDYNSKSDIVYPKPIEGSSREQVITYDLNLKATRELRRKRLAERRPELY